MGNVGPHLAGEVAIRLDTGTDPIDTPVGYPGQRLSRSALLVDDCLHELRSTAFGSLGQALVETCLECDPAETAQFVTLNDALRNADAAPIDRRFAVLSTGSNMAPAVIHRKLRSAGNPARTVVPMLRCRAYGLGNGYSAHIASYGVVPAAVFDAPGQQIESVLLLLDEEQLARLDETEPNYYRAVLDPRRNPVSLITELPRDSDVVSAVHIYRSMHGALMADGGYVSFAGAEPGLEILRAVMPRLAGLPLEEIPELLIADPEPMVRLRAALAAQDRVGPDGIQALRS
jgi:hypothetical protein